MRSAVVYLRHAETSVAESAKWHAGSENTLSPAGVEHACRAGRAIQEWAPTLAPTIFCSSYRRVRQTAQILAEYLDLDVRATDELRERDLGKWSGLSFEQIEERWPGKIEMWQRNELPGPPGGETNDDVTGRLTSFFSRYLAKTEAAPHLVIAHAGVLRALLATNQLPNETVAPLSGRWITFLHDSKKLTLGPQIAL